MPHGNCWRRICWSRRSPWALCFYCRFRYGPVCSRRSAACCTVYGCCRGRFCSAIQRHFVDCVAMPMAGRSGIRLMAGKQRNCAATVWHCRWSWCCGFACAASGRSGRSACHETRRRPMCIGACAYGSNSADVGGRHQNSVERLGQHLRVIEGVMQAATFLAFHGRADHQFGDLRQIA